MNDSFIVGDAGGNSTQWRVVREGQISQYETIGFNAYTHNLNDLKTSISQTLGAGIADLPTYFYAAGIGTEEQKEVVSKSLLELFQGQLVVENDLVGVARGLCGRAQGNACILGTGSNACYYDGEKVSTVSASLGYVLGDEGSGADLGKRLLMRVFRAHFDQEILDAFDSSFGLTSHEVIQRIYYQERPNHFLSSFAPFVKEHIAHPDVYQLVKESFSDFFDAFFRNEEHLDAPFNFSGSVAWFFSDILREVASEKGLFVKNIVQSPIAGLVLYHENQE